jgi:hypothetical protein
MKTITIKVLTDHNSRFWVYQEIRYDGKVIHEQCICCSELYEGDRNAWKLNDILPTIHDKKISYSYISDYERFDNTKAIKKKIEDKINEYKYNVELKALKEKYGYQHIR